MSGRLARKARNFSARTTGSWGGKPRLVLVGKTSDKLPNGVTSPEGVTGLLEYGEVKVNANATTPFSRGKVHKGSVFCENALVNNGDLVYDRYDQKYYFVMSKKGMMYNGETVRIDATMYLCDAVVSIQRFGQGIRDTFGRVVAEAPETVATDLPAMFNPQNYDVTQQEDRLLAHNKIQLCLQSSSGVAVADRIVSSAGKKFVVQSIDAESLENLLLCVIDTDER